MEEYKRFLAIWDCIHIMNANRIFTYGIAEYSDGSAVIIFENDEQKQRYTLVFGG